jgi:hypothetical protein
MRSLSYERAAWAIRAVLALALAWVLLTLDPVGVLSMAFFIACPSPTCCERRSCPTRSSRSRSTVGKRPTRSANEALAGSLVALSSGRMQPIHRSAWKGSSPKFGVFEWWCRGPCSRVLAARLTNRCANR